MLLRAVALAMLTASLTLIGNAPVGAAAAPGYGSLSAPDSVLYDGCVKHVYYYTLGLPTGTDNWNLSLDVKDAAGGYVDSGYLFQGANPNIGGDTYQACGSETPGTWSLSARLEVCDYQADLGTGCTTTNLPTAFFTVRPASTRTYLTPSTRHPRYNQTVSFVVKSKVESEDGYVDRKYQDVYLQVRSDNGRWRRVRTSKVSTNELGRAKLTYRWNLRGSYRLRAVSTATDATSASESRPVTIG